MPRAFTTYTVSVFKPDGPSWDFTTESLDGAKWLQATLAAENPEGWVGNILVTSTTQQTSVIEPEV